MNRVNGGGLVLQHYPNIGNGSAFDRSLVQERSAQGGQAKSTVNGRDAFTVPTSLALLRRTSPIGCVVYLPLRIGSSLT